MKIILSILVLPILLLSGCNIINPSEEIPGFIYIEGLDFDGSPNSDSHNISDVWVYSPTELIGIYQLPAYIPILEKGFAEYTFRAGIRGNGLSTNRSTYPYYSDFKTTLDIQENSVDTVQLFFDIISSTIYPSNMKEDFEITSSYLELGSSDVSMQQTTLSSEIFSEFGSIGSGKIEFGSEDVLCEVESPHNVLPTSGNKQIWAELNYKGNNSFSIGVVPYFNGSKEGNEHVAIVKDTKDDNGTPQWNKIYIDLSVAVGSNPNATDFTLYFQVARDFDAVDPLLFFDNIQVVHF